MATTHKCRCGGDPKRKKVCALPVPACCCETPLDIVEGNNTRELSKQCACGATHYTCKEPILLCCCIIQQRRLVVGKATRTRR